MIINLKPYLTSEVDKVDLTELRRYDNNGKTYFEHYGSIYYPKAANLNELIGEQLATEIGLRTVDFELFENNNGEIFIASRSFNNPNSNYTYYTSSIDLTNNENDLRDECIDENNYNQLLNNIFKMFAIDVYMGQKDRCYVNYPFEKYDSGYFALAPVHDYSDSSWDDDISYCCDLYDFNSKSSYDKLFNAHPNSLEIFKQVKEITMSKILKEIELNKGIKLPQEVIDIYLKREEISQKKLEKIIK